MPTAVTGSPAILNEIRVSMLFTGTTPGTDEILVLPAMEGTQGNVVKNFERSPVLRSDRQGGVQVGGTTAAEATLVVPVVEEASVKFLLTSLFRAAWSTPGNTGVGFTSPTGTLKPGTTRKPFSLELKYTAYDAAGTPVPIYETFTNAEAQRCTITFPTSGVPTMAFDIQGTAGTVNATPLSATAGHYRALAGNTVMASSVTGCMFGYRDSTSAPTTDDLFLLGAETLSIVIDNNGDIKYRIGSSTADHLTQGDFDATMSGSIYYRNTSIAGFFTGETRKWYQITTKAGDDATLWGFHLPKGVISGYSHGTSGPTVTENVTIFGEFNTDADANCKFMIIES